MTINSVSHNISSVNLHQHQQSTASVQKAASEKSEPAAEERTESPATERAEQTGKTAGNKIDKYA